MSFLRTKTNNRGINLATTSTILWMEVKGRRAHRPSEAQGDYYRLPIQLKHHLANDLRGRHSKTTSILEVLQEIHTQKY